MADEKSGSLFVRLRSVRNSAVMAVFFGATPIWFVVSLFMAATAREDAVYAVQLWAKNFGDSALDDAQWIIPSLLGLLVAVYASDYGARRQLNRLSSSEQASRDERVVIGAINVLAVAIAAFAFFYLFVTVATVIVNGTGYGHILDLAFSCMVVFVLGASVGLFSISTPERLLELNDSAKKRATTRLSALGSPVGPRRPALVISIWVAGPTLAAGSALWVGVASPHSGYAFLVSFIGLATGGLGLGFAAAASAARIVQRDTTEGRVYW